MRAAIQPTVSLNEAWKEARVNDLLSQMRCRFLPIKPDDFEFKDA